MRASAVSRPRPEHACGSVADARKRCLGRGLGIQNSHLSKDTGCLSAGGRTPFFASVMGSLSPGREKLSTYGLGRQQDARRDCNIPPMDRRSGRRTAVPAYEWQTEEAILVDFWPASPPRHMRSVPTVMFFLLFGDGISCIPSHARQNKLKNKSSSRGDSYWAYPLCHRRNSV